MSEIALYDTLRKIPNVSAAEAKEAVADIANTKDVATKADIAEVKTDIAELRAEVKTELKYMRWLIVIVVSIAVAFIKYLP